MKYKFSNLLIKSNNNRDFNFITINLKTIDFGRKAKNIIHNQNLTCMFAKLGRFQ